MTHVGNTAPQDALAQAAQLELGQNPNALAIRRPFDPTAHELEANFRLTRLVSFIKEITVLGIRIRMFLGLPDPDPLVEGTDPIPYLINVLSGLK